MADSLHVVCPHCDGVNRLAVGKLQDSPRCGRCHEALFTGAPIELDARRFRTHLSRSDLPLIVDFWAPWCGPCRAMAPAFAQAAAAVEPKARFVKVDVDANPELSARYDIRGIPALIAFNGGKIADRQTGLVDARSLRAWAERLAAIPA